MFVGRQKVLVTIANDLKISDVEFTDFITMPLINGDREICSAIILQNLLHPKNSNRRDAIDTHSYIAIANHEQAVEFLSRTLLTNLKNDLSGKETQIRTTLLSAQSMQSAEVFLNAPDIYFAASILLNDKLLIGSGDRTRIIHTIRKAGSKCLVIKDKLILLQKVKFLGFKMFHDDFKKWQPEDLAISRHEKYLMWLTLVRQKQALTNEDYIEAFPDMREQAEVWIDCIDDQGVPSIDKKKMYEYIKKR